MADGGIKVVHLLANLKKYGKYLHKTELVSEMTDSKGQMRFDTRSEITDKSRESSERT